MSYGKSHRESLGFRTRIDVGIHFADIKLDLVKIRAKDSDECILAIKAHVGYVINIVGRYVAIAPTKSADMLGSGLYALTRAVWNFHQCTHDNLTGYIMSYVHGEIKDFLARDHTVYIPRRTINYIAQNIEPEYQDEALERLMPSVESFTDIPVGCHSKLKEVYEEILSECLETEEERAIVRLRLDGYADAEIAAKTGLTRHDIYYRIKRIKTAFFRKLRLYKEE